MTRKRDPSTLTLYRNRSWSNSFSHSPSYFGIAVIPTTVPTGWGDGRLGRTRTLGAHHATAENDTAMRGVWKTRIAAQYFTFACLLSEPEPSSCAPVGSVATG